MPETRRFSLRFDVRWADLDANRHVRNTAYLDFVTHLRFSFFGSNGFPPSRFGELNFGPVILREEMRFFKEVGPGEVLTIDVRLGAMSPDGRKFRMCHDIVRGDGQKAAEIETDGAWMDLTTRKLRVPPDEVLAALRGLERTDPFREL